ncbi:hypothetical protein EDB89DRAFT_1911595 [Lactarius sanguifluus]|nr:hypothetical protein EDB89DRAFT_1911595 [Lactarius sanguifluus]
MIPAALERTPPGARGRPRLYDDRPVRPNCIYCESPEHLNYDCPRLHLLCLARRQCRVPHNHVHRLTTCTWREPIPNAPPHHIRHRPYRTPHALPVRPQTKAGERPLAQRIEPAREEGEIRDDEDHIDWSHYADMPE